MSQIRSIKNRILLVKKTQKVTKAMKMIAGIKFRRVESVLKQEKIYFQHFQETGRELIQYPFDTDNTFLRKIQNEKLKNLLIVFSAERGLCGHYNSAIISKVKDLWKNSKKYDFIVIGQKALKVIRSFSEPLLYVPNVGLKVDKNLFDKISASIFESYHKYNSVNLLYMKSGQGSRPQVMRILPLSENHITGVKPLLMTNNQEKKLFDHFIKEYLFVMLRWIWLESNVSEEFSRMLAMDSATKNGEEMVQSLSLKYNRLRQANITKEIIEIVSGADSLAS